MDALEIQLKASILLTQGIIYGDKPEEVYKWYPDSGNSCLRSFGVLPYLELPVDGLLASGGSPGPVDFISWGGVNAVHGSPPTFPWDQCMTILTRF